MEKRDYIDLIKVAEAIIRLDNASKVISGCGLDRTVIKAKEVGNAYKEIDFRRF